MRDSPSAKCAERMWRSPLPKVIRPVVFTGVQHIVGPQFRYINDVLDALRGNVFITGGAYGIDTYVATRLLDMFPKARHICVVPYEYKANEVHHLTMEKRGELWDMAKPTRKSDVPELLRNDYMLELAQELNADTAKLVAFPGGPNEVLRSGTWSTIRYARKREMKIEIHPLSEAETSIRGGKEYH